MTTDIARPLSQSRSILVVKLRYVGDAVWTLPFLENLKRNLPDASIAVVASEGTETFFRQSGYVDRVLTYPERAVKQGGLRGVRALLRFLGEVRSVGCDAAIDLTDSDKAAAVAFLSGARTRIGFRFRRYPRHRLLTRVYQIPFQHWVAHNLELVERLGLTVFTRQITCPAPATAQAVLRGSFPEIVAAGREKVLVHPGARAKLRQWGSANYAALCDLLAGRYRVFLVAGPDEKELLQEVLRQMKTAPEFASAALTLQEFAALSGICDLFVGNDSGPIHIAATRTFTVGIYGPNSDDLAGPWTDRKYVFEEKGLPCRTSCSHRECLNEEFHACMSRLTPTRVFEVIGEILGQECGNGCGYPAETAPVPRMVRQ